MLFPEQTTDEIAEYLLENDMNFALFEERMIAEGLPKLFIQTFAYYYEQLVAGATGMISELDIDSVCTVPDVEQFPRHLVDVGQDALTRTAVIKLNGGLGTSMGLEKAKSLLSVKDGRSFLEIITKQAEKAEVPLVLMNSFTTEEDSQQVLRPFAANSSLTYYTFVQHKEPKIRQADLKPVDWPENPELEWCPPGHGDIYTALVTSGTLDALLAEGIEYVFVSNADNLGAVIDLSILGYLVENEIPFMMEVADRTEMDKKGGHLAQRKDGQLILRESAQCPAEDAKYFQDISRHKYFNTNNLWFHLPTLKQVLEAQDYRLGLPMIRNSKPVDPRHEDSTPVYQLETAMGAAIAVFKGAEAIRVPRSRFAPVKTTNDLLLVRSDVYKMTDAFMVLPENGRTWEPVVSLDSNYYKIVSDFDARFPHGVPSMKKCTRLEVVGDVVFGKDIVCEGNVLIVNESGEQVVLGDGLVLNGRIQF